MADGEEERDHVVRRADEDAAQDDPERHARPSELGGKHRPHDRSGAGDGGKVVAEEDRRVRGHVVHAVALRHGRRRPRGIKPEKFPHEAGIDEIADEKTRRRDQQQCQAIHLPYSLRARIVRNGARRNANIIDP